MQLFFTCDLHCSVLTSSFYYRYHGEKLIRNQPRTAERDVVIATVYDKPEDIQKKEPLLRRHDHYTISYRDSVHFKKAESENT